MTWSADHGLLINKTKCAECLFYPRNTSSKPPLSLINGEELSREQTVKYIGVRFNSNLTWSTHIDSVFSKDCVSIRKCIRLPSTSSGVAYTHICKILISQQHNSCTRLCSSIINDPLDPLHACLSNALSTFNTRFFFNFFDVELLLIENPSYLAWPLFLYLTK